LHTHRLLHTHWLLHTHRLLHSHWLLKLSDLLLHSYWLLHSHWILHTYRCLHSHRLMKGSNGCVHRCLHSNRLMKRSNGLIQHSICLQHSLVKVLKLFHHIYFLKINITISLPTNSIFCLPNIHFDTSRFPSSWIYLVIRILL